MTLLVRGNDHILMENVWVCISACSKDKNKATSALVVKNEVQDWCLSAYHVESCFGNS